MNLPSGLKERCMATKLTKSSPNAFMLMTLDCTEQEILIEINRNLLLDVHLNGSTGGEVIAAQVTVIPHSSNKHIFTLQE